MNKLTSLLEELSLVLERWRGRYPVGTVRNWHIGLVQKQMDGTWRKLPSESDKIVATQRMMAKAEKAQHAQQQADERERQSHPIAPEPLDRISRKDPLADLQSFFRVPAIPEPDPHVLRILRTPVVPRHTFQTGDGHQLSDVTPLHKTEMVIHSRPFEEARVLNGAGVEVHNLKGDETSVGIPNDLDLSDHVMTHNHPLGLSLSLNDLQLAVEKNLSEIRAVTREHDGVYVHRLLRPASGWPSPEAVREALGRVSQANIRDQLLQSLSVLIDHLLPDLRTGRPGRMTFREADRKFTEEWLAAHAFILQIPYVVEKIG